MHSGVDSDGGGLNAPIIAVIERTASDDPARDAFVTELRFKRNPESVLPEQLKASVYKTLANFKGEWNQLSAAMQEMVKIQSARDYLEDIVPIAAVA